MEKVTALAPILYMGRAYKAGEEIECRDAETLEAWERAGTIRRAAEEKKKPAPERKAK